MSVGTEFGGVPNWTSGKVEKSKSLKSKLKMENWKIDTMEKWKDHTEMGNWECERVVKSNTTIQKWKSGRVVKW